MLGPNCGVYFYLNGGERVSGDIPRGGINCAGLLRLCRQFPTSNDSLGRLELLRAYVDKTGSDHYLLGDLTKGGRRADEAELERLRGRQPNGVPVGLLQCGRCGEWTGESLDPNPRFAGLIMRSRCLCENDTICAGCGRPLAQRRINANYYDEGDGIIWHVPAFKAFDHLCPVEPTPRTLNNKSRAERKVPVRRIV